MKSEFRTQGSEISYHLLFNFNILLDNNSEIIPCYVSSFMKVPMLLNVVRGFRTLFPDFNPRCFFLLTVDYRDILIWAKY